MVRLFVLLFCITSTFSLRAQPGKASEKRLDIFWNSKKQRTRVLLETVDFKPGDTVVDIGTADGWYAAIISAYTDGLTFYLEDIDSTVWDRRNFDSAFHHFSAKINTASSHQFFYVKGTGTSTGLPANTFHKVLIIDTYHHFTHREEMLSHAISLLRPEGEIVIIEALARKPGDVHQGCKQKIYSEEEIISHMQTQGLKLEELRFIQRLSGRKNKIFVFTRA